MTLNTCPPLTITERDIHYTTAFGASVDIEIASALRAGMKLELIYCELSARIRAIAAEITANHLRAEAEKCSDC
jgi:hypothetical protein